MTIAKNIKETSASYDDALAQAEYISVKIENYFNNSQTIFTFIDSSSLLFEFPLLLVMD